jgi:hypothetical protein
MPANQLKSEFSQSPDQATGSSPAPQQPSESKWRVRTGWTLTALSGLFLIFDGVGKLVLPPQVTEACVRLGFPVNLITGVGVLLLICTLAYLIPRTAVLGAVLLTGFLGGAVAIQLRAGSTLFETIFPVLFALLMWGGIYLREGRLCSVLPLRRC